MGASSPIAAPITTGRTIVFQSNPGQTMPESIR